MQGNGSSIMMYYPEICLERLSNTTKSFRIVGISALIRSKFLPNTNRELNRCIIIIIIIIIIIMPVHPIHV
jgi:hypothetical protein